MAEGRQRIDKWLFFARVVKSRSLAAKLAVAGRVRINRDKASQAADHGQARRRSDHHARPAHPRLQGARCRARGAVRRRRRSKLYEDLSPPPAPKGEAPADAIPPLREAGSGRPTKRERRDTDRLRGDD